MNKDIFLTNSLGNKKEKFIPINPKKIGMYVCGPTVYDNPHIGNARPLVVFDILFKVLKCKYGKSSVTYVRKITDVDDKIIARSSAENKPVNEITSETIKWFIEDNNYLNVNKPTHEPKATQYISQMIAMIEILILNKNAYVLEDGEVLFSVNTFKSYGSLSRQNLESMIVGSRVDIDRRKKNPLDFVLWKPTSRNNIGWDSPWGYGRPGWHIECSAMSKEILGETFDIHGGGIDLIFPHHENETAQSICANNKNSLANYWMHNGFVNIEGQKMSKSLGNYLTVEDLRNKKTWRTVLDTPQQTLPLENHRSSIEKEEGTPVEEEYIKGAFVEEKAEGALHPKIWIERVLDEKGEGTPAKRGKLTEGIFVEKKLERPCQKRLKLKEFL